jgi:hypothetical protein
LRRRYLGGRSLRRSGRRQSRIAIGEQQLFGHDGYLIRLGELRRLSDTPGY